MFRVRPPLKVLIIYDRAVRGGVCRGRARSRPEPERSPADHGRDGQRPANSASTTRATSSLSLRLPAQCPSSSTSPTGERSTSTSTREAGWWSPRVIAASPRATTTRSPSQFLPAQLEDTPHNAPAPDHVRQGRQHHASVVSASTARTWTPCSRMLPVYRYWPIKQPAEGTRIARELFRRRTGPAGADLQRAEDRARFALDDAARAAPGSSAAVSAPIPSAWSEFPLRPRAGRSWS